ncbi:MAG: HAD-superfamily hydrolase, subfamily variant 3 [Bryobacterales bacterium]|nr:HAD-superfamily hydrolase, subfamily variant 3 [Bryobacterales bacterium]
MDGVIVDSNPLHRVVWTEFNSQHGITTTDAMFERMYGKRTDAVIQDFFGDDLTPDDVFRLGAEKEALYREMMRPQLEISLVQGVREFMEAHQAIPMAVATNAEPANLDFVLDEAGLGKYIRFKTNGYEVALPKPAPDIYLKAAAGLGVEPKSCVVFEDSHSGVAAALAAGMKVVGITTTHEDLPGVSIRIPNFTDPALAAWLTTLS